MMTAPSERVEQKFFVPPNRAAAALALVRRTCRWDDEYPAEQINSLYFDTVHLDQHQSSVAGEFAKDKVRIRWYGTEHDPHEAAADSLLGGRGGATAVWLELKSRRGFASIKQRKVVEVAAGTLDPGALGKGIVPLTTLMQTMAGFGFFSPGRLLPVVAVSYWRCRFVEPRTGFHVAFDSRIRSTVVMPGVGRGERGLELAGGVIEVKGLSGDLPVCLRQVGEMGSSWTRYSKYSSSLDAHESAVCSVSRLWPSGTMHAEPCSGVPMPNREVTACGSK
jgi:hypothetical protein